MQAHGERLTFTCLSACFSDLRASSDGDSRYWISNALAATPTAADQAFGDQRELMVELTRPAEVRDTSYEGGTG
jgi:hypothetical protein